MTQFGQIVSPSVVEAMACYAQITTITTGASGEPIHASRVDRAPAMTQRDALELRDRHCRYQGCDRLWCIAHRIRPQSGLRAAGIDDMVLLCEEHHLAAHKGAVAFERTADGSFTATPAVRRAPASVPDPQPRAEAAA